MGVSTLGMAHAMVLAMLSTVSGASLKDIVPVSWVEARGLSSLRGVRRGRHHVRNEAYDRSPTPLYDDFLDIMNHAVGKAIAEQRAVPAYDDFLHVLKKGADKASGKPMAMPSYEDFLDSLKASTAEAAKEPVPSYEDFLAVLKDGAEQAMKTRVAYTARYSAKGKQNPPNPFKQMVDAIPNPFKPKPKKNDHEKLREELKALKEKKQKEEAEKGPLPDHVKKPLMKRINVLRTQLCWKRPNLMQHEKCLRFLGIHCMEASTGTGICQKFAKKMSKACKTETDPEWREDYCVLSEALQDSYDVEEEEAADEEAAGEEAADGHEELDNEEDEELDHELSEDLEEQDKEILPQKGGAVGAEPKAGEAGADGKEAKAGEAAKDADKDSDGDGIPDSKDAFADDPNEWKDTDKDGTGDNSDNDIDGDGHDNAVDVFPNDAKEWKDSDNDGVGDNSDKDRDGDGFPDKEDAFPNDPSEWKDSDGDGVGDNKDAHPFNPKCHKADEPCEDIKAHKMPKKGSPEDPGTLDMDAKRPLPGQGFNEAMQGPNVAHSNYYTWVSDWQEEFPLQEQAEQKTMSQICQDNPTAWCKKYLGAVKKGEEEKWWR